MEPLMPQHKIVTIILAVLLGLIVSAGIFALGTMVGFHRARATYQLGERYDALLGMPRGPGIPRATEPLRPGFDGHGAAGIVISKTNQELLLKGPDGLEKTVFVPSSTVDIHEGRGLASWQDIAPDDQVVVFGDPNEKGQIVAKFIRLFNAPAHR